MKILNIFDTGGNGSIFSKYNKDIVTYQHERLDRFHIGRYYDNTVIFKESQALLDQASLDQDHYDHIVVHDQVVALEVFKRHPSVTMHHHGGHLRNNPEVDDRKAHRIFVATKDLQHWRPTSIHIPIPVDTELFSNKGIGMGGLMINREKDRELIEKYVTDNIKDVKYILRDKQYRSYEDMPDLLRQYSFYVDTKYSLSNPPVLIQGVLSGTALQCLSLGLTVYGPDLKPNIGLSSDHHGKNVTEYFIKALNNDI